MTSEEDSTETKTAIDPDMDDEFEYDSFSEFLEAAKGGDLPREFYRQLATSEKLVDEAYARKRDLYDETIEVTHTTTSARIRMNINRGTGVRDQDEVTGELKAGTVDQLVDDIPMFSLMLTRQMEELRSFQPDEDSGESDDS